MRNLSLKHLLIVVLISSTIMACKDDEKEDKLTVDQTAFLSNTSALIVSSYQVLDLSSELLDARIDSLTSTPTSENLLEARNSLKTAYLNWQRVSFYEFGPAATASLKSSLNVYKTDTTQIKSNISSGNFNLDQIAMKDAKGFPALDYLLHGKSDAEILSELSSDSNAGQYLKAVSSEIQSKVNQVLQNWNTYQNDFKSATGTDVGSSTGMLINQLNLHYEKFFRDNKLGIPLGVRSSGIARPDFIESAYGQYSVELLKENFIGMKTVYLGNNNYGLDDYLMNSDATDLNDRIIDQLQVIEMQLNGLSDPLTEEIKNNPAKVQEIYNEMQKLIVLWKVDMPSRMGILITYQDNDGD